MLEFILFLALGAGLLFGVLRLFGKKPRDVVEEIKSDLKDLSE
jgi:hypothetical protein